MGWIRIVGNRHPPHLTLRTPPHAGGIRKFFSFLPRTDISLVNPDKKILFRRFTAGLLLTDMGTKQVRIQARRGQSNDALTPHALLLSRRNQADCRPD
jgi:hypothetical protein